MPEFRPGDVFVNHRIEGLAGRGGMGVVYRATDIDLDRTVALKVITPALAEEADFRKRFVAESKAAASIEHPHVIPVYYAGEREGVLFIVMRFIDGPDLRALVRAQGKLDPERAAHVVAQLGSALDAAHGHGLVHRDVKPANVLLGEDDHAYLTDFGLTKRSATTGDGGGGGLSRAGGWVGTLGYVAPEQIRGGRVDARTDVYALGCVLVYALTGQAPYVGESDEATLWAHLNSPPPSESVPPEFEGVVARALAKDPSDRYPSTGDLGRAALAAAGRSAAPGPERNVARGAAAPPGLSATAATARVGSPDSETHVSPRADGGTATAMTTRGGDPRAKALGLARRPLALIVAAALLPVLVIAAILMAGGDEDPGATTTTTTPAPAATASEADPPIGVALRPNALAVAGGRVWVLSNPGGELVVLDPETQRQVKRISIGRGGSSLTGGFGSVWVLKSATRTLGRYNVRTLRRIGALVEIPFAGESVQVVAGQGALWVAVRTKNANGADETVVKVDPSTLARQGITIPGGVQDLAVGGGALWVTNRFTQTVSRVDVRSANIRTIRVSGRPDGLAYGSGAAWVATSGDDTITRISPRGLDVKAIPVPFIPTRVTVGGGSVWVTAREANRLLRIDPARREVVERVDTGSRPFALDVERGRAVWLTLLNENAVQRVTFSRAGG
ncbi:MAG TPA: protein kinase [Solirubrobacteraceae bacterium]|nr:protein kinase [Solirubrobacteraceae bacterium]